MAIFYNDRAVQENHHVSAAYRLLQDDDEMNILYNLSKDDWRWAGAEKRLPRDSPEGVAVSVPLKTTLLLLLGMLIT